MIDELAKQIIHTLISELSAITEEGAIDHKSRLAALKEARSFIQTIIPKMSKEDKENFAHVFTSEMAEKMSYIKEQEKKLSEITERSNTGDPDEKNVTSVGGEGGGEDEEWRL